jgi:hypothetical protein
MKWLGARKVERATTGKDAARYSIEQIEHVMITIKEIGRIRHECIVQNMNVYANTQYSAHSTVQ